MTWVWFSTRPIVIYLIWLLADVSRYQRTCAITLFWMYGLILPVFGCVDMRVSLFCLFCLFWFDLVWFLVLLFLFCSCCCCGGGGSGGCFATLLAFCAEYKLWGSNWLKLFGWLAAKNAALTGLTWSCLDEVLWNHTEEVECLRLTETLSQTEHCRYWWKWLPYYHEQRDANDFYHFVSYQWRVTRQWL